MALNILSMYQQDNLFVVNSKTPCPVCKGDRRTRKNCSNCRSSGFLPTQLAGMWSPSPGFLVCGGPSLKKLDLNLLKQRGVVSLAVNNVAGFAPVNAWCFSDPQTKFHHGIFLDPKIITFAPVAKLRKTIRIKLPNGQFKNTLIQPKDCPSTFGFSRSATFCAKTFFSDDHAHWGRGGFQPEGDSPFRCLCTMLLGFRLMHYLGCPRIYLLGVDFNMTEQEQYSFGQKTHPHNGRYWKENAMLKELKPVFDEHHFEVFNCNPESKCDVFPYVPFEKAVEDCRGAVPKEPLDLTEWYSKHIAEDHVSKDPRPIDLKEAKRIQDATYGGERGATV